MAHKDNHTSILDKLSLAGDPSYTFAFISLPRNKYCRSFNITNPLNLVKLSFFSLNVKLKGL